MMHPCTVTVEVLLNGVVSLIGKFVHLEKKGEVRQSPQLHFWRIRGIARMDCSVC